MEFSWEISNGSELGDLEGFFIGNIEYTPAKSVNTKDTGGKHGEKLESFRCANIDKFQGEEYDIVIISLVRSNNTGNIGFLKE